MTEEITAALAKVPDFDSHRPHLAFNSRTQRGFAHNRAGSERELSHRGFGAQAGDRVRITPSSSVRNETSLDGELRRQVTDIFAIQEDIAQPLPGAARAVRLRQG